MIFTRRPKILKRKNREATPPFRKQRLIQAETTNKMEQHADRNLKEMGLQQRQIKLFTGNKNVVPKQEPFKSCHKHTVECLTEDSIFRKSGFNKLCRISQKVVNTSIPCTENAQQPLAAPKFLSLLDHGKMSK